MTADSERRTGRGDGPRDRPHLERQLAGPSVGDWEAELDPVLAGRVRDLLAAPEDLVGAMRSDGELLVAVARADTRCHLVRWFGERNGWTHDVARSGPLGDGAAAVEWTFDGVHDRDLAFNGTHASGRRVVVRGLSVFSVDDGRFAVRRYVDWAGTYAQLGLTLNWRVPMPSTPPSDLDDLDDLDEPES